jgi:hypothetical protein
MSAFGFTLERGCGGMKPSSEKKSETKIEVDPDAWERFEKAVDTVMKAPPKHQAALPRKPKERPAIKGRVHRAKSRS